MHRLQSKVAIVTGAGSGIGRAIPLRFAQEGARVTLVDVEPAHARETAALIEAAGGEALVVQADVASREDWARIVAATTERFGRLDVLVNSAGIASWVRLLEHTEEDWDRVVAVNLKSVFLGAQACIPAMIRQGGGAIVNVSSANAVAANPSLSSYIASKAGMEGLSRSIALECGRQGIRSNVISPGMIVGADSEAAIITDADEERGCRDPYLVGRWGDPDDVAHAAVYFASDEAAYVTGATLAVDGGLTAQSPEATIRPSFRARWRDDVALIRDRRDIGA